MTKCLPHIYAFCAPYQKFPNWREPQLNWLLHCQLYEHQRTGKGKIRKYCMWPSCIIQVDCDKMWKIMGLLNSDLCYLILSINNLRSLLFRGLLSNGVMELQVLQMRGKKWTNLVSHLHTHSTYIFFTFMHLAEALIQSKLHLISYIPNLWPCIALRVKLQEHHKISKAVMVYAQHMRITVFTG